MQTIDAINVLQAMLQTIQSSATGLTAQAAAIQLAITQLQGTLQTQDTELNDIKATIAAADPTAPISSVLPDIAADAPTDAPVAVPDASPATPLTPVQS